MKKKLKVSRRCAIKLRIFLVVVVIFSLIHLRYVISLDRENLEKSYTVPDSLMKFPIKENRSTVHQRIQTTLDAFCRPRKGVVFLKTHKTGSTTMTNIFLRYAEKHKLTVGLPPFRKWELAGYPGAFNRALIDPQLEQYSMLCHHFRMDRRAVSKSVPSDAVYVTILRDPVNAFESGFSFFRDGPFSAWMPDYGSENALKKFLSNPEKYYNRSTPWHFRAKNYQSYDLGLDQDRGDEMYLNRALYDMDNLFDLVMITERFEESLILLKDLLCMESLQDLLHIRLKVRQSSLRSDTDHEMRRQIRDWNHLDANIYDYFLKRLERKVAEYGVEKMKKEVEALRTLLDATEKRCVLEYDNEDLRPWISRIRLHKDSGEFCNKLSWGEVKFGDYFRKIQRKFVKIPVEDQIPPEEMRRKLEAEQHRILRL